MYFKSSLSPVCVLLTLAVPRPFWVGRGLRGECMSWANCEKAATMPSRVALGCSGRSAVANGAAGPLASVSLLGCLGFIELLLVTECNPLVPLVP